MSSVLAFAPPDRISAASPRVVGDARARALCSDMKRCSYYETCATYGLNVDRVFQEGECGEHRPMYGGSQRPGVQASSPVPASVSVASVGEQ